MKILVRIQFEAPSYRLEYEILRIGKTHGLLD